MILSHCGCGGMEVSFFGATSPYPLVKKLSNNNTGNSHSNAKFIQAAIPTKVKPRKVAASSATHMFST